MFAAQLQAESSRLGQIIQSAQHSLETAPDGFLRIAAGKKGKTAEYYWHSRNSKAYGTYLKADQLPFAQALAQKSYDKKVLTTATKQKAAIDHLITALQQLNPAESATKNSPIAAIYSGLHPLRQKLVTPYEVPLDEYVAHWQEEAYPQKAFREDDPQFYTQRGEHVRSKSEVIIANQLASASVPYRYEAALQLANGRTIYPDFTCLNRRTGKIFYWEHLGMMDTEDYCANALRRIDGYQLSGFFPGDQLLISAEASKHPLDTRVVKVLIQHHLL